MTPEPSGSPLAAMTIGMVFEAFLAAIAAGGSSCHDYINIQTN
jgi:hypothetical protein